MRDTLFPFAMLLVLACRLLAAQQSAIQGHIRHPRGLPLSGAAILIQSESTAARWKTRTDAGGHYSLPSLPPGSYKATARFPGFRTVTRVGIQLLSGQATQVDFEMELIVVYQTITVVEERDNLDPSRGNRLLLSRDNPGAALPSNGRDFRSSFDVLPGVAMVRAAASDAGQFTANGQRPNSNAFRIDGVSANTGVGGSSLPGSFPGASLPAMTAIGTTENLVSAENTQAVELRTSVFAPEFGERPGAESSITTRAGSNDFHGAVSGNWRDRSWSARDWFANSRSLSFPRPYHSNAGGIFGGPIWRDRAFFFAGAESSVVSDSGLQLAVVPSMAARNNSPPDLQLLLRGFPLPTGPDFGQGQAEGLVPLGRRGTLTSYNLRTDYSLGSHGTMFARFAYSPSSSVSEYIKASQGDFNWRSATIGMTSGWPGGVISDLRFSFSRSVFGSRYPGDDWGYVFSQSLLNPSRSPLPHPPEYEYATYAVGISVPGLGQFTSGGQARSRQDQWELRDVFFRQKGPHQLRAGLDYIRLDPSRDGVIYSAQGFAQDLQGLLDGKPMAVIYSNVPRGGGTSQLASTFIQDTFRVGESLNIVYGIRWELTPPIAKLEIPTVSGVWTGTEWTSLYTGDINGAAPWPMRYSQIAPRVGLAYRLRNSAWVVRAGAGLFYDTRLGPAVNPMNGAPFNSWQLSSGGTGIATSATSPSAAGIPAADDRAPDVSQFLYGPQPALRLPASYQWRVSMERRAGVDGVASVAYLGAIGSHLLGNETYLEADTGILRRRITLTRNSSNYQALQLRYSGSPMPNVYASAAYTWSHSIDDGSLDSSMFLIHPGYSLDEARASSSFDLRQTLTSTFSLRAPHTLRSMRLPRWLEGWTVSGIFRVRSGFPINVSNTEQAFGRAFDNAGRPDLVPGNPVWLNDPTLAGGRRLNPAAFADPSPGRNGTLVRNAFYGNSLAQLDANIRREFGLARRMALQVEINLFNVLNRPSFADPVPFRSSPLFGQSTSMQNLMLGLGTPNGGLPSLFQTGGPRSAEVNVRFSF